MNVNHDRGMAVVIAGLLPIFGTPADSETKAGQQGPAPALGHFGWGARGVRCPLSWIAPRDNYQMLRGQQE
ncbi:hypothetical protein CKAH01_01787 [Colletotrichum kahawae]|uniref:Uncharacterized protein n=1 Tax=Colletotrichum kahawae TaxID=34407 RepID=A0AAE0D2F9_COLKA|nr:hypothetical protein CKAH01_01787 [Colletotrichum kahawae]